MELNFLFRALFFFLLLSSFSSSSFMSDGVLESKSLVIGRNLLQTRKPCRVNFEFEHYSILTDNCKGPKFPPKECCAAFKKFACPFVDDLNDLSTDCATTMFTYINQHGNYPAGLFADQCKEGKDGIKCPASSPAPAAADLNAATAPSSYSSHLWPTVSAAFLVFIKLF